MLNRPELCLTWAINKILTIYAQKTYTAIIGDPKLLEQVKYNKWSKETKPIDTAKVLDYVKEGMIPKGSSIRAANQQR